VTLPLAAAVVGVAVWAAATCAAYAATVPATRLAHATRRTAWRWITGSPPDDGLCPATGDEGTFRYRCHLHAGHDVQLIHWDRSRRVRWAAGPHGVTILGARLRAQ
jgi:hypothetical protein